MEAGVLDLAIDIASGVLIAGGCFFILVGALGLVRMPDIYTRAHATSVIDTLGAGLLLVGLMLQAGFTLVTVKLLFLLAIAFFTLPVVAHALAQAALHENIAPKLAEDRRRRQAAGDDRPEADA
jgi:multicomponent Na+:H+ antiporter subunit G